MCRRGQILRGCRKMASNQVLLVLFYGEIWKSLSTAVPHNTSMNKRNTYTSRWSAAEDKAPLYELQATVLSLHKSGRAVTVTTPLLFPKAESSDGSWIAALIIGIILISMIVAIIIILLWKCCKRPVLVDSNWAGRSPFADGDTPDVFMESDQAPKRSSILFMLPWKLKQDTNLQQNPTASEKPPNCTTSNENSQLPPPAAACSAASTSVPNTESPSVPNTESPSVPNTESPSVPNTESPSVPNTDAPPSPSPETASSARDSCPSPAASPEAPDLPPPPDWLREPVEGHSSDLSKYQELPSAAEEQLPPPPELLMPELHEPLPQLPLPEHPQ